MARGLTLEDARDYCIIGCVEPQKAGKTDGWHDAAFFNMCRPMELAFTNGYDKGKKIGPDTGDIADMKTFEEFYEAYKAQQSYMIKLLVNANNAIDMAHAIRCPLPFQSCMVEDCIGRGKSLQEGGAIYNFTGPQGFGIANNTDGLVAIKKLVFEEKRFTLAELGEALKANFGYGVHGAAAEKLTTEIATELVASGVEVNENAIRMIYDEVTNQTSLSASEKAKYKEIKRLIEEESPKYGNDIYDVDMFARDVANSYTKEVEKYKNYRGGIFQAGLYPVSANVPLGASTGATPDGRKSGSPFSENQSPTYGADRSGITALLKSLSKLPFARTATGGLNLTFSQKPSSDVLRALVLSYFELGGFHVGIGIVDRETLLDAMKNPEKYKSLTVRLYGFSEYFVSLPEWQQLAVLNRTEYKG